MTAIAKELTGFYGKVHSVTVQNVNLLSYGECARLKQKEIEEIEKG